MASGALVLFLFLGACADSGPALSETEVAFLALAAVPCSAFPTAYELTFTSTWSNASHGTGLGFPPNAHFSRLVGATHSAAVRMWAPGAAASNGIEAMAERGQVDPLVAEMQPQVLPGGGGVFSADTGLASTPGTGSVRFSVTGLSPLVSAVTMLAPSPDWFVGVDGVPLCENGSYRDVSVSLVVYDAGTDSGATFAAADADTQPRGTIQKLAADPFLVAGQFVALGTFQFKRVVGP